MSASKVMNHPVLVGAGQITHREKIVGDSVSAVDLAVRAIDACIQDTGRPEIRGRIDTLSVVNMMTEFRESPLPGICARAGISPAFREETSMGGNNPQLLVNRAADRIMAGECRVALLAGAEALYRDRKVWQFMNFEKLFARMRDDDGILGDVRYGESPHEILHGADRASHIYPLFENALRQALGMSLAEHRAYMTAYFLDMAAVAAGNPLAWFNRGKQMDDITEPTAGNPLFNFPYTKFMNPVLAVNQAAAVLVTDTETARSLGIPREKWVYLHGGAEAADKWYISERLCYHASPLIRFTVEASLEAAGLTMADIDFLDLYSCFPCATIIAAREIGLDIHDLPPLTITGGLSYFGGAGNNYTMHAIAHAVERLRRHPEETGLVTGVGYFLTKYAVGIYSGREPARVWRRPRRNLVQERIDALEPPPFCLKPDGPATVETYTVLHDRPDGVPWPVIIARLDSGERCLATAPHGSDLADRMEEEEFIGCRGVVTPGDGGPNLFQ